MTKTGLGESPTSVLVLINLDDKAMEESYPLP